jgi:ubiquitin-protein ligase
MIINPRLNRLQADYEKIRELEARSPVIQVLRVTGGNPPTGYVFRLTCRGITRLSGGKPVYSSSHKLEISLPSDYPRSQPSLKMQSPIFHPNFSGNNICIGNRSYSPSMGLDDLVVEIVKLIIYANYNPNDPYNSQAVGWAKRNKRLLPLDKRQIVGKDLQIQIFDEINIVDDSDDLLGEINLTVL